MKAFGAVYIDDLTGEPGACRHTVVIDDHRYILDLGDDSYGRLCDALEPFVIAARKRIDARHFTDRSRRVVASAVRRWWFDNQQDLPDYRSRGRIPDVVSRRFAENGLINEQPRRNGGMR